MIKKRLINLLADGKKYIAYQIIWQWVSLISQIIMVYTMAVMFQQALVGKVSTQDIVEGFGVIAVGICIRFFCERQVVKASYMASAHVKKVLRQKIYEKLLRLGTGYREHVSTSEVVQMAAEGVEQLEIYFGRYLAQLIYSLVAPITLFIILATVDLKSSIVLLICVPLIPISIVFVQKIAKKLLSKYWNIYTGLGDSFLENLQGLTTLKIYQADEMKSEEMDIEATCFRQITMKVLTMQLNSTSVMDIVAYGGAAVGMVVAIGQFYYGAVTFSEALMIILLAAEFFLPLRVLGSYFHIAMNGMAASDRIFALLDLEEPREKTEVLDEKEEVSIQIENMDFAYETERSILQGIHMNFSNQTITSIVGTSGCGKSTIAGILMGRNKNYVGQVKVNGIELSDLDEKNLMKHITFVSHHSYLFKGTVRDNLCMGKPDATDEELIYVLEKVNLWNFLQGENGLSTILKEKGNNFSGGQCQRLALARALLHDTPVYIFDEATSNIDVESEELIMNVIYELAKRKTIIMISHRLANVVQSNCIYMLKDGIIAEHGTHSELMKHQKDYHQLYTRQASLEQYGKVVS